MWIKWQNSYCSKCIKNWQLKSDKSPTHCDSFSYNNTRVIKNLICKINFKCKNDCQKIIPFEKFETHIEYECEKIHFREKYLK